jgi:aldose 1-epimerase
MSDPVIGRVRFGDLPDGAPVERFSLRNRRGMEADILSYGGIVTRLTAPDAEGRYADVVLGHRTLTEYLANSQYFGCLIGRHANRIRHGRLDWSMACSTSSGGITAHSLHGGVRGFDKVLWSELPKPTVTSGGTDDCDSSTSAATVRKDIRARSR